MTRAITLDPLTLQFCASLARRTAEGIPNERAHHAVAAAALAVLAEEIEGIAKGAAAAGQGGS